MAATFVSDSDSSSASDAPRVHRPVLLSAAAVAAADGDPGFVDLSCPTIPPLRSFPIDASHPIIGSWPAIKARIMIVLDQSNIKWSSLGVLRRRQTLVERGDDTTVVLALQKGNEDDKGNEDEVVKRVEEDIYEICKSTGNAGLFVEVLVAEITRFHETYEEKARGGSSLGASESNFVSGTLGGYVKLIGENGPRVLAVSCHHVVVPNEFDNDYREAVIPGQGHHIRVSQPSNKVHNGNISRLRNSCERFERDIYQFQGQVGSEPGVARDLEMTRHALQRQRSNLQSTRDFDTHFGTVVATSGYRKSEKSACSLDWALVDVQYTRRGRNEVPKLPFNPYEYSRLSEGDRVARIAPLGIDDYVVKAGSKTNTTYGRISHIKHDCNLPGNESATTTSEYVVVGLEGAAFGSKGDSGAFVLNSYGRLAGLLIAGQEALGTVYVTPIEEVMRDMEKVTGCLVTLP
ncbi:hypothetical protein GP486_007161 [Trichoglossum hirsutum]|uniref:Uncharacterized protein n=1 Tax=Trichoglossum hirsutum TaxID=265104 RepID=A0A9P8IFZ6_9PEZI|nr:hypothetical protein GP486_007161 [Trichoglossum hirsutum]